METRRATFDDYQTINEWFKARKFPEMRIILPSMGFVIEVESKPVAACFAYRDIDGRICWLAWLVTKPGLAPRTSRSVLKELVAYAEKELSAMGYLMILSTGRKGLGNLFTGLSWQTGDSNVNQYFKNIQVDYGT